MPGKKLPMNPYGMGKKKAAKKVAKKAVKKARAKRSR